MERRQEDAGDKATNQLQEHGGVAWEELRVSHPCCAGTIPLSSTFTEQC